MVLESSVELLGSPAAGVVAGVGYVNGDGGGAVGGREPRSPASRLRSALVLPAGMGKPGLLAGPSAAEQEVVEVRSPRESKHFVVRVGRRLGALAARRRGLLTAVGTLLAVGVLVFVLAGRWGQFARAAAGAPWWMLAGAAVLQTGSLLARSESWNVSVQAAGGTVGRRRVYRAAGVGYLGNIVNGELGFAVRIASLRRSAPRETPKAVVLATTEFARPP